MKKLVVGALTASLSSMALGASSYAPAGPIEAKYAESGPWEVIKSPTSAPCDREGNICDIWYPTKLGSNPIKGSQGGFQHPVIVFANGTASEVGPEKNDFFLRHLASWGFVVIRSRDGSTGNGDTVIDAANYILNAASQPTSPFYRHIDRERLGLTGHSQGAGTAVLLFARQNSPFSTFVPIETPERIVCVIAGCAFNLGALSEVSKGSIFFIGGELDVVSPLPVNLGYYTPISSRVDKVMGIVRNAGHLEIEGDPDCETGGLTTCRIGVYPLLGYPTAWFMWKLQDVELGDATFGSNGELAQARETWSSVFSDID